MSRLVVLAVCVVAGCGAQNENQVPAQARPAEEPVAAVTERSLIESVTLELRVERLDQTADLITTAVRDMQGYVASSRLEHSTRYGHWQLRIPAPQVAEFLKRCQEWGTVLGKHSSVEDVTDQRIDLEARLKTKRLEEIRLQELLADKTGSLSDVLTVEKELFRVREEIERADASQRALEHRVEFASVELRVSEEFPAERIPDVAFLPQVHRVFWESTGLLVKFAKGLLLAAIALFPWLVAALVPAGILYGVICATRRKVVR